MHEKTTCMCRKMLARTASISLFAAHAQVTYLCVLALKIAGLSHIKRAFILYLQ